ncbi:MAG: hypothetical protein JRH03_07695, partial [Deltaproteobacteria bacterium]|nr:hypothetical protein [Deltaproteobacteria bacterium]
NISLSSEMEPWRLHNSYDRPIPRRIAEEAGVERHLFGIEKKFVATKYNLPINSNLRKLFLEYLREEHRIHPITIYLEYMLNLLSKLRQIGNPQKRKKQIADNSLSYRLGKNIDLYFLLSIWATSKLSEGMASVMSKRPMP